MPEYHVDESGPDHAKSFTAVVRVGGEAYGSGSGRSKKEAEQQAAEAAWNAIRGPTRPRPDAEAWSHGDHAGPAMPELPEVEVVRRGLERWVAGRTVAAAEVLPPAGDPPARRPAPGSSPPGWRAARSAPPSAGASTSGCRWDGSDAIAGPPRA